MPMLYAETPTIRARQVVWDLVVVAWIVLWVVLGMHLHDLVAVLALPGEELAEVGTSLAAGADRVASAIADTPFIGGMAAPFSALGDAAGDLVGVGEATQRAALRLALWVSLFVAGAAIATVTVPYLLWRRVWVRRATAASRLRELPEAVRLLALRAVVNRPLEDLVRVSQDPLRDVQERPEVLAALELRDLGLRGGPRPQQEV